MSTYSFLATPTNIPFLSVSAFFPEAERRRRQRSWRLRPFGGGVGPIYGGHRVGCRGAVPWPPGLGTAGRPSTMGPLIIM